jgi:hypothetical protein
MVLELGMGVIDWSNVLNLKSEREIDYFVDLRLLSILLDHLAF